MAKVLLASFAGYPYSPSSLMPDNGLAMLAGALLEDGHEVKVQDYGTVSYMARLFPAQLGRQVRPLARRLFVRGERLNYLDKLRFLKVGLQLERHESREIRRIAAELARRVEDYDADFLGLKLWNGDGFTGSVAMAQAVRERLPTVRIIAGGPHVDYFGEHILEFTRAFDVLVRGEGERTLPELIAAMETGRDWRSIPGLIWHEGERIRSTPVRAPLELDGLPLPVYDRDIYPALDGDEKIKIGVVDESRGCPNRCAFCIHPIKSGGKWAVKSSRRVVVEMQRFMREMGTRYFIYSGSNTSGKVAMDIADEILKRRLDVRYGCFGHVRGIGRPKGRGRADDAPGGRFEQAVGDGDRLTSGRRGTDFRVLRESGCLAIFYGLESGSPRILEKAFNKPLALDEAERVIVRTKQAGICAITSIIYPAPFEDARSRKETLDFLRNVRPDSVPVTIPGVIPGTPWHTEAGKYGFELTERKDIWEYALTYKIKLLFPPSLWKPLPYRVNGKSSRRLFRECEEFIRDVESAGMVTDMPHEMVLMAHALGEDGNLRAFRDRCRACFAAGDVDTAAEMVRGINRAALGGLSSSRTLTNEARRLPAR